MFSTISSLRKPFLLAVSFMHSEQVKGQQWKSIPLMEFEDDEIK